MKTAGLLVSGALALGLAAARPAVGQEAAWQQPTAEQTIAKVRAAREALSQPQAVALTEQQQRHVTLADAELARAMRLYAAGRYQEAVRVAERANRQLVRAVTDTHGSQNPGEVR